MIVTSMTSKGQIVIPAKIRARHGLKKGSRIAIQEKGDKLILQAVTPEFIKKMAGSLSSEISLTKELLRQRKTDKLKEGGNAGSPRCLCLAGLFTKREGI